MQLHGKRHLALIALVKPFQYQTDGQRLTLSILRAQIGFGDEMAREIRQSLPGHVCAYCRERKADHADHTFPIAWFRIAALIRLNIQSEGNGKPICLVCDNAKHRREVKTELRIRAALKRHALSYVRRLAREFVAKEQKLIRQYARHAKARALRGETSREFQTIAARNVDLLFRAFAIVRRGKGNADWRGKVSALSEQALKDAFARLTRFDIDESTRGELQSIFATTDSGLAVFNAALETQRLARRANNKGMLSNVKACLKARAAFYAALASKKLNVNTWREKARGETMATLDSLYVAYSEMYADIMRGTRFSD